MHQETAFPRGRIGYDLVVILVPPGFTKPALDAQDINMAIRELSQRTQSYAINDDDDVINLS